MRHRNGLLAAAGIALLSLCTFPALQAQILETETARPLGKGVLEASGNFEYQVAADGRETAIPFALEYGLSNRLELLVEPVAYTAIRPKTGPRATGIGDMEVIVTYLARRETRWPAIAFAGELKFPTAHNNLIGTGRTDIAGYLIASKLFGRLDTHANLGYTIVGRPAGAQLKNIFNFALGGELHVNRSTSLFGEVLANTASSSAGEPTAGAPPGTTIPEAPTGEIVGSLGLARYVAPWLRISAGVSVDNNGAVLFRPGFTLSRR